MKKPLQRDCYSLVQKVKLALQLVHCITRHKERIRGDATERKGALSGPGLSELSDRKVSSVERRGGIGERDESWRRNQDLDPAWPASRF